MITPQFNNFYKYRYFKNIYEYKNTKKFDIKNQKSVLYKLINQNKLKILASTENLHFVNLNMLGFILLCIKQTS